MEIITPGSASGRVEYKTSYRWVLIIVTLFFLGLFYRLFWLQIIKGEEFQTLAKIKYLGHYTLPAPRGRLLDTNGVVLATNDFAYHLFVYPYRFYRYNGKERFAQLASLINLSDVERIELEDKILTALRSGKGRRALLLKATVPADVIFTLQGELFRFPGLDIRTKQMRRYPEGYLTSHLVGYVNEVNLRDLTRWPNHYMTRDLIGRTGLERALEGILRGKKGVELFVKTAAGRRVASEEFNYLFTDVKSERSKPGHTVTLTIDKRVQTVVARAFGGYWRRSGASVVMEVKTGRILAMYSKPGFDPNDWAGRLSTERFLTYKNNPYSPMLNKTVRAFAPGSVYKVVTMVAALTEGLITKDTKHTCNGVYEYAKRPFKCHGKHGELDLMEAIKVSCDVYFYKIGEALGMERLAKYARMFGFGEKTGVELPEHPGRVPTQRHHEQRGTWQPGIVLSTAIGQGDVFATPLQVATVFAALANGGTLYRPTLLRNLIDRKGNIIKVFHPEPRRSIGVKAEYLKLVNDSLYKVVNEEGGGVYDSRLEGLFFAGKTGTAEAKETRPGVTDIRFKKWLLEDHAWFVGYAPVADPEIVVVVLVEHGGFGSKQAAPIAQQIFRGYFNLKSGYRVVVPQKTEKKPRPDKDAPPKPGTKRKKRNVNRSPVPPLP